MNNLAELNNALNAVDMGRTCFSLELVDRRNPLSFSETHVTLATELVELRNMLLLRLNSDDNFNTTITSRSIASWIFHSNRLEFLAQESIKDTEDLVRDQFVRATNEAEHATIQTFRLFRGTCKTTHDNNINHAAFDSIGLKSLHLKLFPLSEYIFAGQFRTTGAYARSLDKKNIHLYPHNGVVRTAIEQLGFMVYQQLKQINTIGDPVSKLVHFFSLAAFCHFHFLNIHPFVDGNGRIGRYIVKQILDLVLPVPFPLFEERDEYISVFEKHRDDYATGVSNLMEIMLKNAIKHYHTSLQSS